MVTFLLLLTGILLVLFSIYPIVPTLYAPAFLHSVLFLVTVVNGTCLKRHLYLYSVVLEFSCVILDLSDSTLRSTPQHFYIAFYY